MSKTLFKSGLYWRLAFIFNSFCLYVCKNPRLYVLPFPPYLFTALYSSLFPTELDSIFSRNRDSCTHTHAYVNV